MPVVEVTWPYGTVRLILRLTLLKNRFNLCRNEIHIFSFQHKLKRLFSRLLVSRQIGPVSRPTSSGAISCQSNDQSDEGSAQHGLKLASPSGSWENGFLIQEILQNRYEDLEMVKKKKKKKQFFWKWKCELKSELDFPTESLASRSDLLRSPVSFSADVNICGFSSRDGDEDLTPGCFSAAVCASADTHTYTHTQMLVFMSSEDYDKNPTLILTITNVL